MSRGMNIKATERFCNDPVGYLADKNSARRSEKSNVPWHSTGNQMAFKKSKKVSSPATTPELKREAIHKAKKINDETQGVKVPVVAWKGTLMKNREKTVAATIPNEPVLVAENT
jgi:hypothetical protein